MVHQQIEEHEGFSTRGNELDLSRSTIQRIIKKDLNYYPCKQKVRQELLEGDFDRRATFCGWLLDKNVRFINNLIVTDEAAFHMNGMVNRQNVRTYSPYKQNPMNIFKKKTSHEKKCQFGWGSLAQVISLGHFSMKEI